MNRAKLPAQQFREVCILVDADAEKKGPDLRTLSEWVHPMRCFGDSHPEPWKISILLLLLDMPCRDLPHELTAQDWMGRRRLKGGVRMISG